MVTPDYSRGGRIQYQPVRIGSVQAFAEARGAGSGTPSSLRRKGEPETRSSRRGAPRMLRRNRDGLAKPRFAGLGNDRDAPDLREPCARLPCHDTARRRPAGEAENRSIYSFPSRGPGSGSVPSRRADVEIALEGGGPRRGAAPGLPEGVAGFAGAPRGREAPRRAGLEGAERTPKAEMKRSILLPPRPMAATCFYSPAAAGRRSPPESIVSASLRADADRLVAGPPPPRRRRRRPAGSHVNSHTPNKIPDTDSGLALPGPRPHRLAPKYPAHRRDEVCLLGEAARRL